MIEIFTRKVERTFIFSPWNWAVRLDKGFK